MNIERYLRLIAGSFVLIAASDAIDQARCTNGYVPAASCCGPIMDPITVGVSRFPGHVRRLNPEERR